MATTDTKTDYRPASGDRTMLWLKQLRASHFFLFAFTKINLHLHIMPRRALPAIGVTFFWQTKHIMKTFYILFFSILSAGQLISQELLHDSGLYYEKPNYTDASLDKYSKDNISYKSNTVFIYDYYYIDNSGAKRKFIKADSYTEDNPMNLTSYQNIPVNGIDKIKLVVNDKLANYFNPDSSYTQSIISYDYLDAKRMTEDDFIPYEMTGVIDNKKNLWIHPPRSYSFKILELNPFPFYYIDEKITRWTWKLDVGGAHYLDSRWIDAKEIMHINYEYIRAKDEILKTPFGEIICKVTNGTATSESNNKLMKTHLKSYYNPKYGFVKLEYDNINGTKLVINLVEIKELPSKPISKAAVTNTYQQNCCLEYFHETLDIRADSTFSYLYSEKSAREKHDGKWKMAKDTLILFDFITNPQPLKTFDGVESFDPNLHDTIAISFQNPINKEPVLSKIYLNGKCLMDWPNEGSTYFIQKQVLKTISTKSGIYYVKSLKSNKFIIYDRPNWSASAEWRVTNISKCILKNGSLIRINCDGTLDTYKLDKK